MPGPLREGLLGRWEDGMGVCLGRLGQPGPWGSLVLLGQEQAGDGDPALLGECDPIPLQLPLGDSPHLSASLWPRPLEGSR